MGVFPRHNKLWVRFKDENGKWTNENTPFRLGEEEQALRLLKKIEARVQARAEHGTVEDGPLTVRRFAKTWIERRKARGVEDAKNDEARLRDHVLCVNGLGDMLLDEVRPRHLVAAFTLLRNDKDRHLAPKTIWNVYGSLQGLYNEAHLDGLVEQTPCILGEAHLGPKVDKDPEWRPTAIYTREELELLISDERVPLDRRVMYALEGIGALRHGEAAGLRIRHYEPACRPLGKLTIATSYDKGRTKSKLPRYMPVHPTLAILLDHWLTEGWPAMMGRKPTADDVFVPTPKGQRIPLGRMRDKNYSWKRVKEDLETLQLRHRRGHDLRRTMISLALADGADKWKLELCTHTPRKKDRAIDLYNSQSWPSLCAEVAKLRIELRGSEHVSLSRLERV